MGPSIYQWWIARWVMRARIYFMKPNAILSALFHAVLYVGVCYVLSQVLLSFIS